MDKSKKSQILKLSLIAALFLITPLLSSSLRPTYLYFILNLLIIALGAEAGLLSSFSKPSSEDKKHSTTLVVAPKTVTTTSDASPPDKPIDGPVVAVPPPECTEKRVVKVVEKSASEKIVGSVKMNSKVKKCPSMPSLFFIGGGENEPEEFGQEEEEEEEVHGQWQGQGQDQLFTRAEMFIGNFYKQLKMQREESWKKIHGFYQKAF